MLSRRAANLVDLAAVTCSPHSLYTTLDRSDRAVEVGLEYPPAHRRSPGRRTRRTRRSEQEYERIWQQLGSRPIEALLDLPLMSDPAWCATMDVLDGAHIAGPVHRQRICIASSSVAWRTSAWSMATATDRASPMCWVGMLLGPRFGDYQAGFRFGKLGLDLVEQRGLLRFKARVYLGLRVRHSLDEAPCETASHSCGALSTRRRKPETLPLRPIRVAARLHTFSPAEIRSVRYSAKPRTRSNSCRKRDSVSSSPRSTDSSG